MSTFNTTIYFTTYEQQCWLEAALMPRMSTQNREEEITQAEPWRLKREYTPVPFFYDFRRNERGAYVYIDGETVALWRANHIAVAQFVHAYLARYDDEQTLWTMAWYSDLRHETGIVGATYKGWTCAVREDLLEVVRSRLYDAHGNAIIPNPHTQKKEDI